MKKSKYIKLFIFGIICLITCTYASKPNISVLTSAASPRMHMRSLEDETHWFTLINYEQQFNSLFSLQSSFEYGSEHLFLENPFRVYLFSAKIAHKNHSFELGRVSHWSGLFNFRFDGLKINLNAKSLGRLTVGGGNKSRYDFSGKSEQTVLMASWSIMYDNKKGEISYWQDYFDTNVHTLAGMQWTLNLLGISYNQQFSYDLSEFRVHSYRTYLSKRFGKYSTALGVRQRRLMIDEIYSWSDKTITIPPTVFFSLRSDFSKSLINWTQLATRVNDDGATSLQSMFLYQKYTMTLLYADYGTSTLIGGQLGYQRKLTDAIKAGVKLEMNALSVADDLIEPVQSKGSNGWVEWSPIDTISLRVFYRYATNEYYTVDGRGGVTIHVAL